MKRVFRYALLSALVLFLIIAGHSLQTNWILFSPDEKFPYHLEYKEFHVHADQPIEGGLIQTLDSVSLRLTSVLDYADKVYQIYLCHDPNTYGIFSKKVGKPQKTQGFNLQPLNHIFINVSFVLEMRSRNNAGFKYHILEGSLSHIIAHEICHQLIADRIGFFTMRKVDSWKLEGFCEYATSKQLKGNDPSYRFGVLVGKFLSGQFDGVSSGRKFYIESMILTEYYLDYRNKSFSELMHDDIKQENLLQELAKKSKEKSL